jgi:hypothetical protein
MEIYKKRDIKMRFSGKESYLSEYWEEFSNYGFEVNIKSCDQHILIEISKV